MSSNSRVAVPPLTRGSVLVPVRLRVPWSTNKDNVTTKESGGDMFKLWWNELQTITGQ